MKTLKAIKNDVKNHFLKSVIIDIATNSTYKRITLSSNHIKDLLLHAKKEALQTLTNPS